MKSGLTLVGSIIDSLHKAIIKEDTKITLLVYLAGGIIGGTIAFYDGFRRLRQQKMVENTPASKIKSVAKGLAEFRGVAEMYGSILEAPLTGKACVYYRYKISPIDDNGHKTLSVLDEGHSEDFYYLKDETGKILVDHNLAEMCIGGPRLILKTTRHTQRVPERIANYIEKKGLKISKEMIFEE